MLGYSCGITCRTEKRDTRREAKALKAAKVENAIEQELLNRLKQGTYGDIYNFDQKVYERVLEAAEVSSAPSALDRIEALSILTKTMCLGRARLPPSWYWWGE